MLPSYWTLALALCICWPTAVCPEDLSDDTGRKVILKRVLRQALTLPEDVDEETSGRSPGPAAGRYMRRLYEEYSYGGRGHPRANTVRSLGAHRGVVNSHNMFVFNLSTVTPSETVLTAEIHLYQKRRGRLRTDRPPLTLILHQLRHNHIRALRTRALPTETRGWLAWEVSDPAASCVRVAGRGEPCLLTLSLERGSKKVLDITKKFKHHSYQPFLVLRTNGSQNISLDHVEPHFIPEHLWEPLVDPRTGRTIKYHGKPDVLIKPSEGDSNDKDNKSEIIPTEFEFEFEQLHTGWQIIEADKNTPRIKRSIEDNEIPLDLDPVTIVPAKLPFTNKVPVQPTAHQKHVASPTPTPTPTPKPTSRSRSRLIPYPEGYVSARDSRRNSRRNRKQHGRPESSFTDTSTDTRGPVQASCDLHPLVVDFTDIGLDQWILAPSGYTANYCAGTCHVPGLKRPTNHATLQSLVQLIRPEVGPGCCVPETFGRLAVLYLDKYRNIVLKDYPDMTARSCACR